MIRLCIENIFNKKRSLILLIGIAIIFIFTLFSTNFYMDGVTQYLDAQQLNDYYLQYSMVVIDIAAIILVLLLTIDHDEGYNMQYLVMVGRTKYYIYKVGSYLITLAFITLIIIFGIVIIPGIFTKYFTPSIQLINHLVTIFLDSFIVGGFSLIFVKKNRKYVIFIILLGYLLVKILLSNFEMDVVFLYYILPLTFNQQTYINNYLLYKILYIVGIYYALLICSLKQNY